MNENNIELSQEAVSAMGFMYGCNVRHFLPCSTGTASCGYWRCRVSIAYSQYRSVSWNFLKANKEKPKTVEEFAKSNSLKTLTSGVINLAKSENDDYYFEDLGLELWLTRAVKFEKVCHYFLEEGVSSFLVNSVKEFSRDYFREEVLTKCSDKSDSNVFERQYFPFFIHFPAKEKTDSIGVVPYFKSLSILIPGSAQKYLFAARDYENCVMVDLKHGAVSGDNKHLADDDTVFVEKLVYGFTLYLDAFPDVIREADGVKHIGHYKGNRHYIRANDIVRTEAHHSVSPHFRRGHFRVLRSDKFKAARGKTIFISGVFVKGKAFDVLADDK